MNYIYRNGNHGNVALVQNEDKVPRISQCTFPIKQISTRYLLNELSILLFQPAIHSILIAFCKLIYVFNDCDNMKHILKGSLLFPAQPFI